MKPLIHISMDMRTVREAVDFLEKGGGEYADIIECGGGIMYGYGILALKIIKDLCPDKEIVADVKMVPSVVPFCGDLFYENGADALIIVGSDNIDMMSWACRSLERDHKKGYFLIDLPEATLPSKKTMRIYKKAGVRNVCYHSAHHGAPHWREDDRKAIEMLVENGFTVSATGSVKPEDISFFAGLPIYSFMLGSNVVNAEDPKALLSEYRKEIDKYFN